MYGGIETGGTKTVCAVGGNGTIRDRVAFPTGDDPVALVEKCAEFFVGRDLQAVGLGTFGPCDPNPSSPTYGHILQTPKPGWADVDLVGMLAQRLQVPLSMTTDVSAAALGELRFGAGQGVPDLVYLTIGTGIGGGVISGGRLLQGATHPEVGHMLLSFPGPGVCPFHDACWEGLASGPALAARLGFPAQNLADDDPAWLLEAQIVAAGIHNLACTLSPQLVIIGGGVGSREGLHRHLPALVEQSLAGYVPAPALTTPGLGADAGVIGALTLAEDGL